MADDFLEVKKHFEAFSQKRDGALKDLSCFLEQISPKCEEMVDEREKLKKKYGLDDEGKFNILKEVNDDWQEPVHSKLLRDILDPKKPVIGGKKNLLQFFHIIGLSDDEIGKWNVDEVFVKTEVTEKKLCEYLNHQYRTAREESKESGVDIELLEREKESRIDILICDKNNCVIIENKLNDASDQLNQLQRYVRIVKKQKLEIQKIVYIPPVYRDASDCDREYRKEQKQIEENKWLVVVPAVRSKADKGKVKSLVQDFFPSIRGEFSEENKTRLVFFDQYEKILAKLGEDEIMKGIEKEVVALLCGTKENQKRTNDLRELLNDEDKFYGLKCELLLEKVNADYGMNFVQVDGGGDYGKLLQCAEEVEGDVYFFFNRWGYGIESKDCKKRAFKGLIDKIKSLPNILELEEDSNDTWNWCYGHGEKDYDFDNLSIEELARIVKSKYEEFKKAVEK